MSVLGALKSWSAALFPTRELKRELQDQRRQTRALENVTRTVLARYRGLCMEAPPELCLNVGRVGDVANYWAQGLSSADTVIEAFGETPDGPVLDWGCGAGRTLHWLRDRGTWPQHYRGCDVDSAAIGWLQSQGLDGVEVCSDLPPLPYADDSFAGLFSFSVLTHIHPDVHAAWFAEIHRVLARGGRAYLTLNGDDALAKTGSLTKRERRAYAERGWCYTERKGHYKDAAFASEELTRPLLADLFEVVRWVPAGYQKNMDVYVVRKR